MKPAQVLCLLWNFRAKHRLCPAPLSDHFLIYFVFNQSISLPLIPWALRLMLSSNIVELMQAGMTALRVRVCVCVSMCVSAQSCQGNYPCVHTTEKLIHTRSLRLSVWHAHRQTHTADTHCWGWETLRLDKKRKNKEETMRRLLKGSWTLLETH